MVHRILVPIIFEGWQMVDPHQYAKAKVGLELFCSDLLPGVVLPFTYHFFCIQIALLDNVIEKKQG